MPDKAVNSVAQMLDFEKNKSVPSQQPKDVLLQITSIQEDMKGSTGSLDGLFGI
jgi:hypothetical protein